MTMLVQTQEVPVPSFICKFSFRGEGEWKGKERQVDISQDGRGGRDEFYKMLFMNKLECSSLIDCFVWISETIGGYGFYQV